MSRTSLAIDEAHVRPHQIRHAPDRFRVAFRQDEPLPAVHQYQESHRDFRQVAVDVSAIVFTGLRVQQVRARKMSNALWTASRPPMLPTLLEEIVKRPSDSL